MLRSHVSCCTCCLQTKGRRLVSVIREPDQAMHRWDLVSSLNCGSWSSNNISVPLWLCFLMSKKFQKRGLLCLNALPCNPPMSQGWSLNMLCLHIVELKQFILSAKLKLKSYCPQLFVFLFKKNHTCVVIKYVRFLHYKVSETTIKLSHCQSCSPVHRSINYS